MNVTICIPGIRIEQDPQVVQIFLETALYDQIERDKKGSMAIHQLIGLVGGTFGLLTGFSLLSGGEVLFFGFKLITRTLKLLRADKVEK